MNELVPWPIRLMVGLTSAALGVWLLFPSLRNWDWSYHKGQSPQHLEYWQSQGKRTHIAWTIMTLVHGIVAVLFPAGPSLTLFVASPIFGAFMLLLSMRVYSNIKWDPEDAWRTYVLGSFGLFLFLAVIFATGVTTTAHFL